MTQSVHIRTLRGPKAVTSHPFKIVPKIEPTPKKQSQFEVPGGRVMIRTSSLAKTGLPSRCEGIARRCLFSHRHGVSEFLLERCYFAQSLLADELGEETYGMQRSCPASSYRNLP
jgi:hypothetical protein